MTEQHNYVTQKECESRRAGIAKDYNDLAERVRLDELDNAKINERIKTLFNIVKLITGLATTILAAEIVNFIGRAI